MVKTACIGYKSISYGKTHLLVQNLGPYDIYVCRWNDTIATEAKPWKTKADSTYTSSFPSYIVFVKSNCCARDGTAIALPMRLFVEQHRDASANATGRNILTSFDFWHCPVFERDAETMPAFAPVPAAQDLLPPMVSLHWWKSCQWKSVFFLWFSDQVPGNKECTSLQIETLLFMQEARSAASGVCSLDISSCFFYILHASCTSCFWYLLCTLQKGQWPAVCFFFEDRSFPSELLLVQRVPGFRSLCQGCRAPALSWDVWQMARC